MDIHEYQAKQIFAAYGVKIADGGLAYSPEDAVQRAREIGGDVWAVKAQIHSGARGKAGGVKICKSHEEVEAAADAMLGRRLVTHQTGPEGKICLRLYIEAGTNIAKELYFSLLVDRTHESIIMVGSAEGGMDIEDLAEKSPEKIKKIQIDTHHFKGNYPDMCSLQAAYLHGKISAKSIVNKSKKWKLLLNKVKLRAHKKHNFQNKLMKNKKVNYIKINIFPDGGISRIRAFGRAE